MTVQPSRDLVGLPYDHQRGRTYEETVISAIRKTLTATAVVTAVLAGTAACGTVENLSAGQKLDRAFEKLGKEKSLSFELGLDTDVKSIKALDADAAPGDEVPDEVAKLLTGARVSVSVQSKKPLADSGEKDFTGMAMKLSTPEGELVEYRVVDDFTYFRADMKAFAKLSGTPVPSADDLPAEAGPFKDVLSGKWVKVETKELEKAGEELGAGADAAEPSPAPSLDAATQKKIVKALKETIAREVEFKTADGKDGAERITATAPFRTLLTGLIDEIRPLSKELPPGAELPSAKDLKEVPNKKVAADFSLKNGELTEVSIDLSKLPEKAKVDKFALTLRMGKGEEATAPSGATEVKMDELMEGFFGGMGASAMGPEENVQG
ncbi:hypothetical protein [Streptomyces sp. NPDC001985]|uniref:hypothetical protein n=1 Tax=Streptomyces sp. NPDC001985 TaxID=3154406 RepID=UPI00331FC001